MKNFLKTYYAILVGHRRKALLCAACITLAGFCEGLAILALIPILQHNMTQAQGGSASDGLVGRLAQSLNLQGDSLFLAGLGAFILLGICTALFTYVAEYRRLKLHAELEEDYRKRMSAALVAMDWARFQAMKLGDINKSLVMEGYQIAAGAGLFLQALGTGGVALLFLLAALAVSAQMTLYTLLFGLLGALVYRLIARRGTRQADKLSELLSNIGQQIAAIFDNLKFFRATGRSALARDEACTIFRNYARTFHKANAHGEFIRFLLESGAVLFIATFLLIMLLVQKMPIASALVFLAIFYRFAPRLLTVQRNVYQARTLLSFYWSWEARHREASAHPVQAFGSLPPTFEQELRLEDIRFTYPGAQEPALQDITLSLPKGLCLAVVGPSGSGKSSLIDLVLGLLPPDSGRILLDGRPLDTLDIEAWRSRIGLVLQDSPIFHATVLENIAWGADTPDRDKALQAARMAHCLEFIEPLPQGLDSVVGEKGGRLSGGQRQRLALARALYRDPWLLVLDEATSALDGAAEVEVQKALEQIKGSCAMLMVAHRLTTVQMADRILVLDKGRIAEQGSWDELLRRPQGLLRTMARVQGLQDGNGHA